MSWEVRQGDVLERLAEIPDGTVQTCITSPPYFGLRDYGEAGQIGLEDQPDEYVARLVGVFREVRRVLRDDGTLWLNLGDSYNTRQRGSDNGWDKSRLTNPATVQKMQAASLRPRAAYEGSKPKDLLMIPAQVALALRADGWYVRSDIIWHKPNPMPESVQDRPSKAHEYLYLLTKAPRYYYDADAIKEPAVSIDPTHPSFRPNALATADGETRVDGFNGKHGDRAFRSHSHTGRNKRTVWTIACRPFAGAHFAVFPPDLVEPCVLAGSSPQACGKCGAPWRRVTERTPMVVAPAPKAEAMRERQGEHARTQTGGTMVKAATSRTVGWEPTCEHEDLTGRSVVLDPFSGAGTTGLVALREGRSYIGIELNPEYAELSRRRIRDDQPLINTSLEVAA